MGVDDDQYPRQVAWPGAGVRVTTTAGKTAWNGLTLEPAQVPQLSQLSQLYRLSGMSRLSGAAGLSERCRGSTSLLSYPILGWPGLTAVMFRSYPYVVVLDTVSTRFAPT